MKLIDFPSLGIFVLYDAKNDAKHMQHFTYKVQRFFELL